MEVADNMVEGKESKKFSMQNTENLRLMSRLRNRIENSLFPERTLKCVVLIKDSFSSNHFQAYYNYSSTTEFIEPVSQCKYILHGSSFIVDGIPFVFCMKNRAVSYATQIIEPIKLVKDLIYFKELVIQVLTLISKTNRLTKNTLMDYFEEKREYNIFQIEVVIDTLVSEKYILENTDDETYSINLEKVNISKRDIYDTITIDLKFIDFDKYSTVCPYCNTEFKLDIETQSKIIPKICPTCNTELDKYVMREKLMTAETILAIHQSNHLKNWLKPSKLTFNLAWQVFLLCACCSLLTYLITMSIYNNG